ncbi:hypothetical protein [Longimicrobium terrae]|uniref:Uncharacterized protein n=1 Tax=Longimicrobium terrae TaxID=1639882 RepID=A0A841H773_9BACT|nr:hypothetical protein [Longimicrobium terrae]MBB4639299.1 hypothetical protein [Longimicrobium terrae]MBB6073539.1 hypothetical protein [Longimicrobium terrae]NNC32213.1 hypothetical protein [Longimicrobium terrae]
MHFWKEGDRSEAICERCEKRVVTRFEPRTLRLEQSAIDVPNVLVGVCTECGETASVPAQSTPKIKEARERRKAETLEARIPLHLDDMLHALADYFHTAVEGFRADLLRFYMREVADDAAFAERVRSLASSELAGGRARSRISLRAPTALLEQARASAAQAGMSDAELIRGIIVAAKEDVLEAGSPARVARLGGAAQAEGAPRLATV